MLNEVTAKSGPTWTDYETVGWGQWFWTHNRSYGEPGIPMLKTDGGYVSPVNGAFIKDSETCFHKVIVCPVGTEVTITVGTRER